MLAWTSWLKSSNSGNAAGKLSLKIRSATSPETGFTEPHYFLLYIRIFPFFPQATVEKSCMQFSIQRPTLPSAETHPEEKLYRRLDVSTWLRHLNQNGQVEEEYKLRKVQYLVYVSVSRAAT